MIKYMYLASRLMKQNKSSWGSAVKNAFIIVLLYYRKWMLHENLKGIGN